MESKRSPALKIAWRFFLTAYVTAAVGLLALGALVKLASSLEPVHEGVLRVAEGSGPVGPVARAVVEAERHSASGTGFLVDYALSSFSLGLAFLLLRSRKDLTARLLAVGMIGSAAAFNLHSHSVYANLSYLYALHLVLHGIAVAAYVHALFSFPDGKLRPAWARWCVLAVYAVAAVGTTGAAAVVMVYQHPALLPLAGDGPALAVTSSYLRLSTLLEGVLFVLLFAGALPLAGMLSQRHRYVEAKGAEERRGARLVQQGLAAATGGTVIMLVLGAVLYLTGWPSALLISFGMRAIPVLLTAVPAILFIDLLNYRPWDVQRVFNLTLLFGLRTGFLAILYFVVVVVAVGQTLQLKGGAPLIVLVVLGLALVAAAFQMLRKRSRSLAERLAAAKRSTPYQVLAEFSEQMVGAAPAEDLLPRMAEIIGEGTGATRVDVWVRVGDELRPTASWPDQEGATPIVALPIAHNGLPPEVAGDRIVPVRHQEELLGAIALAKPPDEPLTPTEEKLLLDFASQAGLTLRNFRLTAELLDTVEELRASRQRLVTAGDEERRRLERNLHDGAQQHLVALKVKVNLAKVFAKKQPERAQGILDELESDTTDAIESLRDLARGIYPPLLADRGLPAALSAQATKAPLPVEIHAEGVGRFPQETEAAAYFCCVEALVNAAKYAHAAGVSVSLSYTDGNLVFSVTDDGDGFDPKTSPKGAGLLNMSDRLAALGGSLSVTTEPGGGTCVTGTLPADPAEEG